MEWLLVSVFPWQCQTTDLGCHWECILIGENKRAATQPGTLGGHEPIVACDIHEPVSRESPENSESRLPRLLRSSIVVKKLNDPSLQCGRDFCQTVASLRSVISFFLILLSPVFTHCRSTAIGRSRLPRRPIIQRGSKSVCLYCTLLAQKGDKLSIHCLSVPNLFIYGSNTTLQLSSNNYLPLIKFTKWLTWVWNFPQCRLHWQLNSITS